MDEIFSYLSAHPAVFIISIILIILLLLNFFFKNLIKLVLIMLIILLTAFGYYYFKDPSAVPEKISQSVETMKSGVNELGDKSKTFFTDSKDLYKRTKESPGSVDKLLDGSKKELDKEFKK
jgi:hypothetical protein